MKTVKTVCLLLLINFIFTACSVLGDEQHAAIGFAAEPSPTASRTPFQPRERTPTVTTTSTQTVTPSVTPRFSPTAIHTSTRVPSSVYDEPDLPASSEIQNLSGWTPAFSLSCEARAAVDWAAYYGIQISEAEFQNRLPISDDPDLGFVGDVNAAWGQIPPNPYGVHAGPVADLLQQYGVEAKAAYGMTWAELRAEIAANNPVIVWVIGHVGRGTPVPYEAAQGGGETTVARFEHVVIVYGYNQQEVSILDGQWLYTRPIGDFLDSWNVLGNMAIVRSD